MSGGDTKLTFRFDQRSYSGKGFRPRPEIHFDRDAHLLLVATPWGPRGTARKVIDRMLEFFLLAKGDAEVTSPFEKLTCLSSAANHLRTAALLANEMLYREDNQQEYRVGAELFGASFIDSEFIWLQLGQPQVMLCRANGRLLPVGGCVDLAFDMSDSANLLPALPGQLLGLDPTVNLTINSFRAQPNDRILLISHSAPPSTLYSLDRSALTLDSVSALLAETHPDIAFWIGVLDLIDETKSLAAENGETTFVSEMNR